MAGDGANMKGRILAILRESEGSVSRETIGTGLGVPAAIEKEIQELRSLGYDIGISPQGYLLGEPLDALFPWEFPRREDRIHYHEEVASTMDIARDLARDGCPDFTVVIAGRQVKGRGRLKRTWLSSEGGLYFNTVLRPQFPPAQSYKVNFLASLVLSQVLHRDYGIDARVKWPNDVLVEGEKISGMLAEMETEAGGISYINLGIGINVNNDPAPVELRATSVKSLLGREVSRRDLLAGFLDVFQRRMGDIATDDVIAEWKRHTMTLNQKVRIVTTQAVSEGVAIDVTETGALLLKQPDGTVKTVVYGDCFLV